MTYFYGNDVIMTSAVSLLCLGFLKLFSLLNAATSGLLSCVRWSRVYGPGHDL